LINKNVVTVSEFESQIKKQDVDELSENFKQSLDFSLKIFGEYEPFKISKISHIYPEWKKHEKSLKAGKKSIVMDPEDFHENPDGKEFEEKKKK